MQLDVLAHDGKVTGRKVDLPDSVFGVVPNEHVVYLAVKQFLATQRQGTHKVKGRSEVWGSSRKLHKQKGTGGSRKGNIRNPLYKGGGTIFGPQPRDYGFKLNKKVKDLARVSVLSEKAGKGAILIVEDLQISQPKTKSVVQILGNLSLLNKKVLVLTRSDVSREDFLYLSLRNLPSAKGIPLSHASVYDLLGAEVLLFEESLANFFVNTGVEEVGDFIESK